MDKDYALVFKNQLDDNRRSFVAATLCSALGQDTYGSPLYQTIYSHAKGMTCGKYVHLLRLCQSKNVSLIISEVEALTGKETAYVAR